MQCLLCNRAQIYVYAQPIILSNFVFPGLLLLTVMKCLYSFLVFWCIGRLRWRCSRMIVSVDHRRWCCSRCWADHCLISSHFIGWVLFVVLLRMVFDTVVHGAPRMAKLAEIAVRFASKHKYPQKLWHMIVSELYGSRPPSSI